MSIRPISSIHPVRFASLTATALAVCAGALASGELLETHDASLTSYLHSSATPVQDLIPHDLQRAVHFDGTPKAGTGIGASIHANPFGSSWGSSASVGSIDLATGAWNGGVGGIALPATVPWTIGVRYSAQQDAGAHVSDGYQGRNWIQTSQPELVLHEDATTDADDLVYIVFGTGHYAEFQRQSSNPVDTEHDAFKGVNGAGGVVLFEGGTGSEPDTYTMYDQFGQQFVFFGFDVDAGTAAGQLWKIVGTGGDAAYVGHETTGSTAISSGYDGSGRITDAYDSEGRHFEYTYTNLGVAGTRLAKVEAIDGATTVAEVDYAYYTALDIGKGNIGDLKTVTRTTPLSESGRESVDVTYLRYSTTGDQLLKLVVGPHGTFEDSGYATSTDADLKPLSDWYFEYDGSDRVTSFFAGGSCGCSGAIDGTHSISYGTMTYTNTSGYDHEHALSAEVVYPSASAGVAPLIRKVFMDETGQRGTVVEYADSDYDASDLMVQNDPEGAPDEYWVTIVERDATRGTVTTVLPPHITDFDLTQDDFADEAYASGLRFSERGFVATAGATLGLPDESAQMQATGSSKAGATSPIVSSSTLTTVTKTVAGTVSAARAYASDSTAPNSETTTLTRTFHTGDASMRPKKITTSRPVVATANNGSNAAVTSDVYYRADGTMAFREHPDGRVDYSKIEGGLMTERVTDVTSSYTGVSADATAVGITLPSTGFELETLYTHDDQGRTTHVEGPTGRVAMTYWTDLDDDRVITFSIPRFDSGTGRYYSPVRATLANKRGQAVASGTIAFSGGYTTTAPSSWIDHTETTLEDAIDHGTLTALNETIYDDSGARVIEVRSHYNIAAPTGYDTAEFAYDDLGRRVRAEDATGTIDRMVYDVRGRIVERWTGTNDTGWPTTGNMVKISETEYDGGVTNGPGLVTEQTVHLDGTGTNTRVTEYVYDLQNRLKITKTPEYPWSLVGYDSIDRVEHRASYTSAATLTSTTDPDSYTTGRISLSETDYDEWGRPFRSITHGVQRSGGSAGALISPAEQLTSETWYDDNGRAVKTTGASISKTAYDSAGRATHRFTLAKDADGGRYTESTNGA